MYTDPDECDDDDEIGEEEVAEEDEVRGHDAPLVAAGPVQGWWLLAALSLALLVVSWIAGAPQLSLPVVSTDGSAVVPEIAPGERAAGLARLLVLAPLVLGATVLGVAGVAFMRRRPLGDLGTLAAKSAALAALSLLVWLVPSEIRIVKQALNTLGVPILGGLLAIPILGFGPRDAGLFVTVAATALAGLVLGAWAVVWATS